MKPGKASRSRLFFILTLLAWLALFLLDGDTFTRAWGILRSFLLEMAQVLPFVLILSALISEWIPAQTVKKHLGEDSSFRGALFAYILGSLSAGPIYAAFPVCLALKKKGASVRNLTILISTWAVIKVPMLFMELKSLGLRFTIIRYSLTLPTIFLLGILMDFLVTREQMSGVIVEKEMPVLPGKDCGGCGFATCAELANKADGNPMILRKRCEFLRD